MVFLWRLLLAIICALFIWRLSHAYIASQTYGVQDRLLQVQLAEVDRQLTQYSFIPKILAGDAQIREAVSSRTAQAIESANLRLRTTQEASGLEFAFLLDTRGLTIASSNHADLVSFVGINYSFRPYFKQAVTGESATFFAVGATTGVPGYFIAEPVVNTHKVLGVVVAKVDLDVIVRNWTGMEHDTMVTDETGVIILSTRTNLLYTPTRILSESQQNQLQRERRYELQLPVLGAPATQLKNHVIVEDNQAKRYVMSSQSLAAEPWHLSSLVSVSRLNRQALFLSLAIYAALLIAFLLFRLYRQQQRLVRVQRINSRELEAQVKQRTQELASAQRRVVSESNFAMLGRMSAAINHEINQPLASLRLNLASLRQMIQQREPDHEEIEQIVVDSDRTTKRIGRVISSLRSVAKKNKAGFASISVERLIDDVYQTITRERSVMSRAIEVQAPIRPSYVQGNEVLLQQALLNLLYNALDAVLHVNKPKVIIETSITEPENGSIGKRLCISVVDNGQGVDVSVVDTLFEPFSTNSTSSDGLGLGLTIARQIAVDHEGELIFRHASQTEPRGSCFVLSLPLFVE